MCVVVSSSPKDALSMAMRYADSILVTRDFSVDGNVASVSALFPAVEGMPSYATFEANFQNSTLVKKRRGQALMDANACEQAKKRRI